MAATEITLDARDLEPPEPFERAVAVLERLQRGERLRLIVPRRPRMLYPWLEEHGFCATTDEQSDDRVDVIIWRHDDSVASG